jgi:hypothetical protein
VASVADDPVPLFVPRLGRSLSAAATRKGTDPQYQGPLDSAEALPPGRWLTEGAVPFHQLRRSRLAFRTVSAETPASSAMATFECVQAVDRALMAAVRRFSRSARAAFAKARTL